MHIICLYKMPEKGVSFISIMKCLCILICLTVVTAKQLIEIKEESKYTFNYHIWTYSNSSHVLLILEHFEKNCVEFSRIKSLKQSE